MTGVLARTSTPGEVVVREASRVASTVSDEGPTVPGLWFTTTASNDNVSQVEHILRLSHGPLADAARRHGLAVTAAALDALPCRVEFDDALAARLLAPRA